MRLSSTGRLIASSIVWTLTGASFPAARLLAAQSSVSCAVDLRAQLRENDTANTRRALADCLEAEGKYQEAAEQFRAAATQDPSEDNLFAFGSELLRYHGYQQALTTFSYAASRFPTSARLQVGLGIAKYSLGQYDAAVATLCHAVDLDPSDIRALTFLGTMTGISPTLASEVREDLKRFATLYPRNATALYYFALSLLPSGFEEGNNSQTAEAQSLLERAVKLQPEFPQAHFQLGRIYQQTQQPMRAIQEYKLAVRQQPTLEAAHYHLAQMYSQTGEAELAKQQYLAVKKLHATRSAATLYPAKSAADDK